MVDWKVGEEHKYSMSSQIVEYLKHHDQPFVCWDLVNTLPNISYGGVTGCINRLIKSGMITITGKTKIPNSRRHVFVYKVDNPLTDFKYRFKSGPGGAPGRSICRNSVVKIASLASIGEAGTEVLPSKIVKDAPMDTELDTCLLKFKAESTLEDCLLAFKEYLIKRVSNILILNEDSRPDIYTPLNVAFLYKNRDISECWINRKSLLMILKEIDCSANTLHAALLQAGMLPPTIQKELLVFKRRFPGHAARIPFLVLRGPFVDELYNLIQNYYKDELDTIPEESLSDSEIVDSISTDVPNIGESLVGESIVATGIPTLNISTTKPVKRLDEYVQDLAYIPTEALILALKQKFFSGGISWSKVDPIRLNAVGWNGEHIDMSISV